MGTILFKTLAPFLLTVVLLTSGQYLAIGQSYSSYAWTKKAKWAVVSNHFHEGLLSVVFDHPLGTKRQISRANSFQEVVKLYGYIDKNGKLTIPPKFLATRNFQEGLAAVIPDQGKYDIKSNNYKWGFADRQGNIKIPAIFDRVKSFSGGLAAVEIAGKWAYIDKNGKIAIQPKFLTADSFQSGFAQVKVAGKTPSAEPKCIYVNAKGSILKTPENVLISCVGLPEYLGFHDGLSLFKSHNQYGYMNSSGKVVIPAIFRAARGFSEGLALVELTDHQQRKVGYINQQGEFMIKLAPMPSEDFYIKSGFFKEGLSTAYNQGKWGFIDRQGTFVIPAKFSSATEFIEGLSLVKSISDEEDWFIDKQGNQPFARPSLLKKASLSSFREGLAAATFPCANYSSPCRLRTVFINKQGSIVIDSALAVK
jgi:hypothetical protein